MGRGWLLGSKHEEQLDFRLTSDHSARRVSTGTDIPAKNRFSSGILLLKTVNDVLCRATDSRCPISSRSLLLGDAVPDGGPRLIDQHP